MNMRKAWILCCTVLLSAPLLLSAQVARHVNSSRVAVGNRSVNQNVNVNRNVNVNQNVNVNRNVNVHRGGVVVEDNNWNWGSFAAGAAATAVTSAAVHAATSPHTTTVVATPAMGTVVTTLPGSCNTISAGGGVIYDCNNIHYQPFYQGTTLVYQVVQ
jgi:hypothetical protein